MRSPPAGIEPGGFGVEDDFPHRLNLSAGGEAETSENIRAPGLQLWIGRRRCRRRNRRARACPHRASGGRGSTSSFASVIPGRASTRARCTSAGAETTMTLSKACSPWVSNSKGMSNSSAGASALASNEARALGVDGRVDDRLERGELVGIAEDPRGERVAVEHAVIDRARKALADRRDQLRPRPCSRRTTASASNTRDAGAREHLGDGRLAHADRAGERDPDHDGSRPRSRSAPSKRQQRHAEDGEMVAVDALEQLHAAPLQPEHADAIADLGPFGIEIVGDEGLRQRTHLQACAVDVAPVDAAVARQRHRAGQHASACPRRSADARRPRRGPLGLSNSRRRR